MLHMWINLYFKKEMLNHIGEKHGNTPCHRFFKNEFTVKRCIFSNIISAAINVEKIPPEARAPGVSPQDFPNLHATGPVMWSQMAAQSPKSQSQRKKLSNQEIQMMINQMREGLDQIQYQMGH